MAGVDIKRPKDNLYFTPIPTAPTTNPPSSSDLAAAALFTHQVLYRRLNVDVADGRPNDEAIKEAVLYERRVVDAVLRAEDAANFPDDIPNLLTQFEDTLQKIQVSIQHVQDDVQTQLADRQGNATKIQSDFAAVQKDLEELKAEVKHKADVFRRWGQATY